MEHESVSGGHEEDTQVSFPLPFPFLLKLLIPQVPSPSLNDDLTMSSLNS